MAVDPAVTAYFAEARADLLGLRNVAHLWQVDLRRVFRGVRSEHREGALAFADKFVSVFNTVEITADTPAYAVTNPRADRTPWPGVWRLVKNELSDQHGAPNELGLVQSLARGYTTSVPASPADWGTYARIKGESSAPGNSASDNPARLVTLEFPFCAPQSEAALVSVLGGLTTVSNAVVANGTLSGAWYPRELVTQAGQDDGIITMVLLLSREQYQLTGYSDHASFNGEAVRKLWGVPKTTAQSTMDVLAAAYKGCTVLPTYNRDEKLVDLELRHSAAVPQLGYGTSGGVGYSDSYGDSDVITRRESGARASVGPSLDTAFVSVGTLVTTENQARTDGRWDVSTVTAVSKEQVVARHVSENTALGDMLRMKGRNIRSTGANFTELTVVPYPPSPGVTVRVSADKNPDATWDVDREERESRDFETLGLRAAHTATASSVQHTAIDPATLVAVAGSGEHVSLDVDPTEYFGRVRSTLVRSTAVDISTAAAQEDAFTREDTEEHTAAGAVAAIPLTSGVVPSGQVWSVDSSPDEHKARFRTRSSLILAKAVDLGAIVVERDDYSETTRHQKFHQTTRPVLPSGSARMQFEFDKWSSWNSTVETVTPFAALVGEVNAKTYVTWGALSHLTSGTHYYTSIRRSGFVVDLENGWIQYIMPDGGSSSVRGYVMGLDSTPRTIMIGKWKSTHTISYHLTETDALAALVDARTVDQLAWDEVDGDFSRVAAGLWRTHRVDKTFVTRETSGVVSSLGKANGFIYVEIGPYPK